MTSYRSSLIEHWPRVLTLICGHPCCLKSTVSRIITQRYEIFGVFTHQMGPIRAMWGEAFEQQRAHRYTRALEISRAAMLNGVPLIVEGTFGSIGERMVLAEVARRAGFSTILVYAYASRHEVVLERFRHRAEQDCGPDHRAADPEIFFDSVRRFERPGPEEIELYDTYAEIDSSTKEATLVKGASPELRNVVDAICTVYHEISW